MKVTLGNRRFLIDWSHAHFTPRSLPGGIEVAGSTTCIITPEDEQEDAIGILGVAWCSTQDIFEKETGRKVSLTRALERWGLARTERAQIWEAYHGRV